MNIVMVSDFHLSWKQPIARRDNTVVTQFRKLEFILSWCRDNRAILLQAGDFFDSPRSWYLLPRVISVLKEYEVPVFSVFGQHDMYMYNRDIRETTCLGVLEKVGLVRVLVSKPYRISSDVSCYLYGAGYGEEVPSKIERKYDVVNILVIHAPIAERALWPGHTYISAEKFLDKTGFDVVLCGDIHREIFVKRRGKFLVNTGCIMRRTADKYNFTYRPLFYVYDTDRGKVSSVVIPHQSAKDVLSREHIEREQEIDINLGKFISSVKEDFDAGTDFEYNLSQFIKENNIDKEVCNKLSEVMQDVS